MAAAAGRAASEQLRDRRPREAYRSFIAAGEIVPGFRDTEARAHRAFELGVVRIAVLPFDDDTRVPGLAEEFADYCLAPPDWKSSNSEGWKAAEKGWKDRFGDWSVPNLITAAHDARERPRYRSQDRDRFYHPSRPEVLRGLERGPQR